MSASVNGFLSHDGRRKEAGGSSSSIAADDMNRNAANALLKRVGRTARPRALLAAGQSQCARASVGDASVRVADCSRSWRCPCSRRHGPGFSPRLWPARPGFRRCTRALARLADGSIWTRGLELAEAGRTPISTGTFIIGLVDALPGIDVIRLHALADRALRQGRAPKTGVPYGRRVVAMVARHVSIPRRRAAASPEH